MVINPKDEILAKIRDSIDDSEVEDKDRIVQLISENQINDNQKSQVFQVNKELTKLSTIFELLVKLKNEEKVIDDFSFYEASLQQVFIQINNQITKANQ